MRNDFYVRFILTEYVFFFLIATQIYSRKGKKAYLLKLKNIINSVHILKKSLKSSCWIFLHLKTLVTDSKTKGNLVVKYTARCPYS